MKFLLSLFLLCFLLPAQAQGDDAALERALFDLPGVQFQRYADPKDGRTKFILQVKQPLDHQHPERGHFYQKVVLTHKGFALPTVMETEGYEGRNSGNEIEKLLGANNLNVEFRYFGTSRPDSLQWQYLTIEQAVADLHHIRTLFARLYPNQWVTTGISRGGQTAIYYKRFYPDDVSLAIPYVAAIPNGPQDPRIYTFLDTVGTPECRRKLFEVQKFLLQHQDAAVNKLKWYAKGKGLTFTHFGSLEKAFEMYVLEYPFSFWQIGFTPCEAIPTNRNVDDYLDHLLTGVGGIEFMADKSINQWAAHSYMARTQQGYYGYDLARYRKYLRHVKGPNPSGALVPDSLPNTPYDPDFTAGVLHWLETQGNGLLYIYGSTDTWSGPRVIPSAAVNAKSFLIPGANHYVARVKAMSPAMQQEFADAITRMTGLPVNLGALKK
ncbi:S28 family serine protease [Flaviaesturariibacter amylovorans]|uniref:S28 family serine protease n=1 Tax=Flaviaesturariibacter amylovorans TaxID=1084520 RepID=A0ABP8HVL8_9BACT